MTTRRVRLLSSLVFASALGGGMAQAATDGETGWYVGASVGQSSFSYPSGGDHDEDAYGFHGGYRLNRYLAFEGAYADQGDQDYRIDCPVGNFCVPETYPILIDQSFSRASLSVLGIIPINERFELFGKLGYVQARYEESVTYGLSAPERYSEDYSETVYGVGGRWHMRPSWSLRLEWDRNDLGEGDVDSYLLSLEYRFSR